LVFAGSVQAAGDAEWAAGTKQVNDTLRQLRVEAQGVPEAMQYVNQAERLWKQAQEQWAMYQRHQQQQMRNQLLTQQQNLMNQLTKQQQFLQQQLAGTKTPEFHTINPFGDYRFHGVSLHPKDGRLHGPGTIADTPELSGLFRQPDRNAKEGPGMEAWKEAMRQLDSISNASSSFPQPLAASSQTPHHTGGAYDNPLAKNASSPPYANDPNVVDLSDSKTLTPMLLRGPDALGGGEKDLQGRKAPEISEYEKLAKQEGWSSEEQARLGKALNDLGMDGDPNAKPEQVSDAWKTITTRDKDANLDLAKKASQGDGPVLYGAGQQTVHQDCVVFAVATAAGQPYGVVAARANEIVQKVEGYENSQQVIEKNGLWGEQVVMLAETFGQAEVIPSSDFAKVLKEGSPVLVAVRVPSDVPKNDNPYNKHQVVLSKVFQNGHNTWYEMIESNTGPLQRLYLTEKQLQTVIWEKGVIFRPDPGTTVPLLR
jgi:hypothetical protein